MKKTKKALLIWPPIVDRFNLPLGIPSLIAYLKKKDILNTQVFDMNIAYLREFKSYWLIYLLRIYCRIFVTRILKIYKKNRNTSIGEARINDRRGTIPHEIKGKNRIITYMKLIDQRISIFLWRRIESRKKKVPWTLKAIMEAYLRDSYPCERKKIRRILNSTIKPGEFSLIGISANYPEQLFFALLMAAEIKDIDKDIRLVIGGAQVTKHINRLICDSNFHELIDFFVTNEGEEPLFRLLENQLRQDLSGIPNLYFSAQSGYVKSDSSFNLSLEDFISPDFQGFDMNYYEDRFPVLASRGCLWSKCNFCTYPSLFHHAYRISTVENILNSIGHLKRKHRVTKLHFLDDALPPLFMGQLAESFIQNRESIDWRANIILMKEFANPDFCRLLKKSGLSRVVIGLESVSPRILTLMNKFHKDMSELEIVEILRGLKSSGIAIGLNIIFGFPTETISEARQTLDFMIKNSDMYDGCAVQPFSLEDDTPIINNPEMFGITKIYRSDKDYGKRLGHRFEVSYGMSQLETRKFTYGEARKSIELKRRRP